jgi:hypothetical protein
MIDYVMAGIHGFDPSAVADMMRWAKYNHDQYGYDRFLLAFVAERTDLLDALPSPEVIPGVAVTFVPLLLDLRAIPRLDEVGKAGKRIAFYANGETLDDWMARVERNLNESRSDV